MNHEVFAESSKFATEAIGAFRTVTSLTLEDEIVGRYARLLGAHTRGAWLKARWWTLVFAMSDSISLLCMAFVLWYVLLSLKLKRVLTGVCRYGGQLLASHEYLPFNYRKQAKYQPEGTTLTIFQSSYISLLCKEARVLASH